MPSHPIHSRARSQDPEDAEASSCLNICRFHGVSSNQAMINMATDTILKVEIVDAVFFNAAKVEVILTQSIKIFVSSIRDLSSFGIQILFFVVGCIGSGKRVISMSWPPRAYSLSFKKVRLK